MKSTPVWVRFPEDGTGRQGVQLARERAAHACRHSAYLAQAPQVELDRDESGAPRPSGGWYWSRSHTRGMAVGLVAPHPVGVDVESLKRPRLEALRRYFLEQDLGQLQDAASLLGLWTAKEAVSKLSGEGVAALPRTQVTPTTPGRFSVHLDGRSYAVRSTCIEGHVIAVAFPAGSPAPAWPTPLEVPA